MKNYNEDLEKILTAIFGLLGIVVILWSLDIKGYGKENWLDAVKDIVGLVVVLIVFIATIKLGNRTKTYMDSAREVLVTLQKKHDDFLMGPRYNRENYDPEKGQGMEYLFVTNADKKSTLRAKLIPIQPLEEGILNICISASTLADALHYGRGKVTEQDIQQMKKEVRDAVIKVLEEKYNGDFELIPDSKDSAIIIDFDETKMGKKRYSKAVAECAEMAVLTLKSHRV